jgi:hypothetical protein
METTKMDECGSERLELERPAAGGGDSTGTAVVRAGEVLRRFSERRPTLEPASRDDRMRVACR